MVIKEDIDKLHQKYVKKKLSRARAIKLYCRYLCCANDVKSWKECTFHKCFLYPFRTGRITHSKPQSFKKTRKTRMSSEKQSVLQEVSNAKEN